MLETKKLVFPEAPLSIVQRLLLYKVGNKEGALWGSPWVMPVKRKLPPPTFIPIPDNELCNQCGLCIDFCPEGIIFKADKGVSIDYVYCKGCLICVNECKRGAMKSKMR